LAGNGTYGIGHETGKHTIANGQTFTLGFVLSEGYAYIYIDGLLFEKIKLTYYPLTSRSDLDVIEIGRQGTYADSAKFIGVIDEVMFFGNKALSASIKQLHNAAVSPETTVTVSDCEDSITLTATINGYVEPVYTWYLDGEQLPDVNDSVIIDAFPSPETHNVTVEVCEKDGPECFSDTITLYAVSDGDSTWNILLSDQAKVVAADSSGDASASLPFNVDVYVYLSDELITDGIDYTIESSTGLTANVADINIGQFTVTAISADTGSLTIRAAATDEPTAYIETNFSVAKSKAGTDAAILVSSDLSITLPAAEDGTVTSGLPRTTFNKLEIGGVPVSSGVTYTRTIQEGSGDITINSSTGDLTITTVTADLVTVDINADDGTHDLTNTLTIAKAKAGTDGTDGDNGLKTGSGFVYYANSTATQPSTPSATSFNIATGAWTGLTTDWDDDVAMSATSGNQYWRSKYVYTETTVGGGTAVPTFSSPVNFVTYP
jgi:hypothetical protein